ncbi:MAG: S-methyl-5-thioribose-1-phosphate isomerase [bacterium]
MDELRGLLWNGRELTYLDQTLLPHEEVRRTTSDWREVVDAIKRLAIRGAPAIGVAGACAAALAAAEHGKDRTAWELALDTIENARPTAVNLSAAVERLRHECQGLEGFALAVKSAGVAAEIADEDESLCEAIAEHGIQLFDSPKVVLTHCNTGALVTYGIGTALGVVRRAHEKKLIKRVYACEARPLGQGSRLTMWELDKLQIPSTLLADSAAGSLLASGVVDMVIVGADRIAANGDTANKIGTLNLAVLANRYRVPFYVAAPSSTFDPGTPEGTSIPIEFREPDEVRKCGGKWISIPSAEVYNPAFDVTPSELISGIIFERGVLRPPFRIGDNRP